MTEKKYHEKKIVAAKATNPRIYFVIVFIFLYLYLPKSN